MRAVTVRQDESVSANRPDFYDSFGRARERGRRDTTLNSSLANCREGSGSSVFQTFRGNFHRSYIFRSYCLVGAILLFSSFLLRPSSPVRRLRAKDSSFFRRRSFVPKIIILIDLPTNNKISSSMSNFANAYCFYAVTDARRNTWENTVNI